MSDPSTQFDLAEMKGSRASVPSKPGPREGGAVSSASTDEGVRAAPTSSTLKNSCKRAVDDDFMIRQGMQSCRDIAPVNTEIFNDGGTRIHVKGAGLKVRERF